MCSSGGGGVNGLVLLGYSYWITYPTHNSSATSASAYKISSTSADFTAYEVAGFSQYMPLLRSWPDCRERCILGLVLAAEGLLHEATAILHEIVADLAAGEGQAIESI